MINGRAVQPHGRTIACIEASESYLTRMIEAITLARLESALTASHGLFEGRTFGKRVVRMAEA